MDFAFVGINDDYDDRYEDYWLPRLEVGSEHAVLDEDEQALFWTGLIGAIATAHDTSIRHPSSLWSLPKTATVTVTNKRLIWASRRFDPGHTYSGFGAIGVTAGLASTAASKRRAAKRSEGKALVGQLRFEWIAELWVFRPETPSRALGLGQKHLGLASEVLSVPLPFQDGSMLLSFSSHDSRQLRLDEAWAVWLAQLVARHRLQSAALSDADRSALQQTAMQPLTDYTVSLKGLRVKLPGSRLPL